VDKSWNQERYSEGQKKHKDGGSEGEMWVFKHRGIEKGFLGKMIRSKMAGKMGNE
jgi:hypothetical protein